MAPRGVGAPGIAEFLASNRASLQIGVDGRISGAGLIDPSGGRVFLLGEVHGVAINYPLDLGLLRHFHAVAGVRHYLAEISHAHALYLNRFLATGDEASLDLVLGQMQGFVDCSEERRDFFVALRDWNDGLPEADRVRVVGIDLERMPGISLAWLQRALKGRRVPKPLRSAVTPVLAARPETPDELRAAVGSLAASVTAHPEAYRAWLGEEAAFDFSLVVDNLQDRYRALADRAQFDALRDRVMRDNFLRLAGHARFASIYGRVGSAHVLQHGTGGVDHFSTLLNRAGTPWSGTVVGLWPLYANSRHLSFADGRYGNVPCTDDQDALAPFVALAPTGLTLFRLTGADSPFAHARPLPASATEGATTDYFQYAILIKDGQPATPLPAAQKTPGRP